MDFECYREKLNLIVVDMKQVYKLNGVYSYFVGSWSIGHKRTTEKVEVILYGEKNEYKEKGFIHLFSPRALIVNGKFQLKGFEMCIDDIVDCTEDEIVLFNEELSKHNMCYGEYTYKHKHLQNFTEWIETEKKAFGLMYKDKDKVFVKVNDELVPFKDLSEKLKGKYVTRSGDNGYSHYWAESVPADKVVSSMGGWFDDITLCSSTFSVRPHNRLVYCGNHFGYNFDKDGTLCLKVTDEPIKRVSVVSNT